MFQYLNNNLLILEFIRHIFFISFIDNLYFSFRMGFDFNF